KFSGSRTSEAPCLTASETSLSAAARLSSRFAVLTIWTTATLCSLMDHLLLHRSGRGWGGRRARRRRRIRGRGGSRIGRPAVLGATEDLFELRLQTFPWPLQGVFRTGQAIDLVAEDLVKQEYADRHLPVDQVVQYGDTTHPRDVVTHRQRDIQTAVNGLLGQVQRAGHLKQTGRTDNLQAIVDVHDAPLQPHGTVDLLVRQASSQQVVTEAQSPDQGVKIDDADQFKSAVRRTASHLQEATFVDLQIQVATQAFCCEKSRTAWPVEVGLEARVAALQTRSIAETTQNAGNVISLHDGIQIAVMLAVIVAPHESCLFSLFADTQAARCDDQVGEFHSCRPRRQVKLPASIIHFTAQNPGSGEAHAWQRTRIEIQQ